MTEKQAVEKVLGIARAQIGTPEGVNNWNIYAQELAAFPELFWGGTKQNQPWCGIIDVWFFYKAFGLNTAVQMLCADTMPNGMAACEFGAGYFRKAGRWYSSPQPGDIIFYGPTGKEEHQGIVESVNGSAVFTIEGNWSDKVSRRQLSLRDPTISGYGRPRWYLAVSDDQSEDPPVSDPDTTPEPAPAPGRRSYTITLREIRLGDIGVQVERLQALLIMRGYDCGGTKSRGREVPDGEFGASTLAAVRDVQLAAGIEIDGIVGQKTMSALLTT